NSMAANLTGQVRNIAEVTTAVARGDLSKKITGEVKGEILALKGTINTMVDQLNGFAAEVTRVAREVGTEGKLGGQAQVKGVGGEILEMKSTINTLVDQLNAFASEVTRVAKEVGTEGKLGGQAQVKGVGGVWKDLTDNVNSMAANLTSQVRSVASVVTAVAMGDLNRKMTVEAKGEVAALADTINGMIDQLDATAGEVTNAA